MAISILGPLNKVINDTTTEIISSQLTAKVAGILTTVISSSFSIVDDALTRVQDSTKKEQP